MIWRVDDHGAAPVKQETQLSSGSGQRIHQVGYRDCLVLKWLSCSQRGMNESELLNNKTL